MSSSILYWGSGSPPCWRAMIALNEKGISYENKQLSFDKKEHKGEDVLKLNPRGQLPTFKDGECVVNESLAIIDYLEDTYPDQGTQLLPRNDKKLRADTIQRKYEVISNFDKKLMMDFATFMFKNPKDAVEKPEFEEKVKAAREELSTWNKYLENSGGDFIMGKVFTVADVVLVPMVAFLFRFGLSGDKYPAINEYYKKMMERPSVKNSVPPHWANTPAPMDFCKHI